MSQSWEDLPSQIVTDIEKLRFFRSVNKINSNKSHINDALTVSHGSHGNLIAVFFTGIVSLVSNEVKRGKVLYILNLDLFRPLSFTCFISIYYSWIIHRLVERFDICVS